MPGFLQVLSVLPVGVPFMAFNARAAVSIGEFFSKSPVRAAAYEQVWKYVTDQNLKLSMIGKDEIEEQRKMMPAYDRWRMTALGGLFPSLGRTGRVAEDMSQEINYGGFAKYAPMTEYLKRPEEGHGGQAMRAITSSSPVWSGTYMLYTGEHPHFKSPIFNEHDSTTLKIYKTFREQVKMLVPTRTYMPDTLSALHGWGDERIRSAEEGIERFGRKRAEEVWRAKLAANAGFPGVAYGNEFLKSFTGRGVAHTKREIFQDFDRLTRSYVLRKGRGALYLRTEADLRRELHSLGNDLKTLTERAGETWTPKAWDVDGMVELLNAERDKAHPERAQLRNTIRDTQQTLDKLLQSQQTTP